MMVGGGRVAVLVAFVGGGLMRREVEEKREMEEKEERERGEKGTGGYHY